MCKMARNVMNYEQTTQTSYPDGRVPTTIEARTSIGNILDDLESQVATIGQFVENLERILIDSGAGSIPCKSENPNNPGTIEGRLLIMRDRNRYAMNLLDVIMERI